SLSGGEKARARIARLVLQESDVLLLDEPGNDLDIDTLESLEESMQEFAGAVMLISHDRYMIEAVCDSFLGVHADGRVLEYASFEQWLKSSAKSLAVSPIGVVEKLPEAGADKSVASRSSGKSAKLSYKDQLEYDRMEERILQAEGRLENLQNKCTDPKVMADSRLLVETCTALDLQKKEIEELYSRWEVLEEMRRAVAAK
ncbi:MAG: ATP-binding cassette domain-containing protein, partial [bacterium]|nr:ATP-binding cassette domain-containing protein [bacterium]